MIAELGGWIGPARMARWSPSTLMRGLERLCVLHIQAISLARQPPKAGRRTRVNDQSQGRGRKSTT
jgi:hypothetical protein